MTLNELWVRIFETFIKGAAYAVIATVMMWVLCKRQSGERWTLGLAALSWTMMSVGSFATSWSIYTMHPVAIAWFGFPSCLGAMTLAALVIGNAPKLGFMWVTWCQLRRAASGRLDDVEIASVRVRPLHSLVHRLGRRGARYGDS